jgi:hypothetical protein
MILPTNIELVIFDCDGVLVDSEPIINQAHAEILSLHGYPVTANTLAERFSGMSDADMLGTLERERGSRIPADYEARVSALIDAYCETALRATLGTHEALAALGISICVASSGVPHRIRTSLRIVGPLASALPATKPSTIPKTNGRARPNGTEIQRTRRLASNGGHSTDDIPHEVTVSDQLIRHEGALGIGVL